MNIDRIMFAGIRSGSGKTTITCGILKCLMDRGLSVASFKCGPDYIDPMFHREVIGTDSYNLDSFLAGEKALGEIFLAGSRNADISVIEGVMGYYDGIGFTDKCSSYEVAALTQTPVILIAEAKGMGNSLGALMKGFLTYKENSYIVGVIFNRLAPTLYEAAREKCRELGIACLGFVPELKNITIQSRHLGLLTTGEIENLENILSQLGEELAKTVDIEKIIKLAEQAPSLMESEQQEEKDCLHLLQYNSKNAYSSNTVRIAIAMDSAFLFYYRENLKVLEMLGAELVPFSPMKDKMLPEDCQGLYLGGGYPELYGKELQENQHMRESIKEAIQRGLPTIAECGGFLYLLDSLKDKEGIPYQMVGIIQGEGLPTDKLQRFGYITMRAEKDSLLAEEGDELRAHEFHYWNSTANGEDFEITKVSNGLSWMEGIAKENLYAGFPHLYFPGNEKAVCRFLDKCREYQY